MSLCDKKAQEEDEDQSGGDELDDEAPGGGEARKPFAADLKFLGGFARTPDPADEDGEEATADGHR